MKYYLRRTARAAAPQRTRPAYPNIADDASVGVGTAVVGTVVGGSVTVGCGVGVSVGLGTTSNAAEELVDTETPDTFTV